MTIQRTKALLAYHAFSRLRLAHAIVVDAYEVHVVGRMPVNRLLFVCDDGGEGKCSIRDGANGELLPMRAGHVYFIPCNRMAEVDVTPELRYVSWHFNLDLFYGQDVFEDHPRCETLADPQLVAEARDLMEHDEELRTLYRVNEIIFHLCAHWSPADRQDGRERLAKSHQYERVLDFVRKSDATTTVAMLADLMGMRKDVFSRKFTRDMGITPKSFISRTLVRKASDMLLAPGASVTGVARALNFSSEYYFSHFFKRHTGTPPSLFRKHNAGR